MKVLITGITGFIGAELAKRLVREGHEVYGMVRHVVGRTDESLEDVEERIKFVTCDITDYFSVRATIKKVEPEIVFHLAALSPVRLSFDHPFDYQKSVYFGTINIAEALRDLYGPEKVRMIIASTAEVYGMQGSTPFVEDLRLEPSSPYAVAKASMDMYIRMLIEVYNFNAVLLRNANTFGRKYDNSFFTEYLITEMLNGKEIYIGAPDSIRDYMYVDDHVNSYILAMTTPEARGNVFNIAGGKGYTNKEWTLKVADAIDFPREKIHFGKYPLGYPTRPLKSDQPYLVLDSSKAQKILGWKQTVTPEEGLKKTMIYWKDRLTKKG
ncbi:MAG: SDR family NAD(P)-dependent oxidoreductase [archaeon]|nr:SDR family NAD(P)-dependent oxidoreductase [archaeon]MCR4323978.1 SDR family NAD(P)-dependent oxidoreductase [Nanoarchaeota archaeon]